MLQNEIYLEILHHNVSKKYCKKKLLSYQIRKKAAFKTINRKFLIAILPVFFHFHCHKIWQQIGFWQQIREFIKDILL